MEFLVTAINEIHKFGTCEPAVNQQVIERYLVAYRILHHIQQLDTLAHEILFLAFGNMALLVTLALITPIPLFRGKPLFLAVNFALLAVKREVEHELRAAIAPAQHQSLVAEDAFLVYMREYLAYGFHMYARLWKIRVIGYQYGWKQTLLMVLNSGPGTRDAIIQLIADNANITLELTEYC